MLHHCTSSCLFCSSYSSFLTWAASVVVRNLTVYKNLARTDPPQYFLLSCLRCICCNYVMSVRVSYCLYIVLPFMYGCKDTTGALAMTLTTASDAWYMHQSVTSVYGFF